MGKENRASASGKIRGDAGPKNSGPTSVEVLEA